MDKLAEWGIAAHHSGRWVSERESDAMGPRERKAGNDAAAGYQASNSPGSSSCLNDADIARRVSRAQKRQSALRYLPVCAWSFLTKFCKESDLGCCAGQLAQVYSRLARGVRWKHDF